MRPFAAEVSTGAEACTQRPSFSTDSGQPLLPDAILNQQLGIDIAGHEDTAIDHRESGSVSDWWTPSSTVFPFLGSEATSCLNFGKPYMTPFATTSRPGLLGEPHSFRPVAGSRAKRLSVLSEESV
jgi:hypothetical protein